MKNNMEIRKAVDADLPQIKTVFRSAVLYGCSKDYDERQLKAWVEKADDARWSELWQSDLVFWVAIIKGRIVGFASVSPSGYIHSLFVDADCQRKGVASALMEVVFQYAQECQIQRLTSDVSITARPFFLHRGFVVDQQQEVEVGGVMLTNYQMSVSRTNLSSKKSSRTM